MEELQVRPGDVVASKYRVEKVLGEGGMGVVVAARHIALGNLVAIKLMQPRAVAVKGAVERFLREGQAAAQLQSKHVAKVLDVGQLESGAPYMIMEHLSGGDLAHVIEKNGAVALPDACEYLLQACDAIGEAHAKGIVHRDLKPANLFLQSEPDGAPLIKVLDFGIAKVAGSGGQGLTGTSQGMGSGGYMSPEQMSSAKKVDHRADIWALGVTLYELLTAHRPFEAESLEQFVTRVFWEQPTPLATHRPDLPREVEAILLRCMEKQPDGRFSTVAHFAQAIAPYAPPRAHPYVTRIARVLGVDAPNLAQTNPGMSAPPGGAPVPTAFGPVPPVAIAAPAASVPSPTGPVPAYAAGSSPHVASASTGAPGAASASGPHPLASPSSPQPFGAPSGPQPLGANQSGPHPLGANQSGPQPLGANQSGPHPLAASQPGGTAIASQPYLVADARVSTVPGSPPLGAGASTDMTGERLNVLAAPAHAPKKPPIALFAAGAVVLLAVGGGGVFLAMRPAAPADVEPIALPAVTTPPTGSGAPATSADAAKDKPADPALTADPATSGTPSDVGTTAASTKPAASGKTPVVVTKPPIGGKPSNNPSASSSAKPPIPPTSGIGGTRQ